MQLTTGFAFTSLLTACLSSVIPPNVQARAPGYTEIPVPQPQDNTASVQLNNRFAFIANDNPEKKRDMTFEHVPQPWQSNLCDTSKAGFSSESLEKVSERAKASDCSIMLTWLRENPGYFMTDHFTGLAYADLLTSGTCAFGFYRTDGLITRFDLGNQDIIDLVDMAIRKYKDGNGQVGAAGQLLNCGGATAISWSLYNVKWEEDGTKGGQ